MTLHHACDNARAPRVLWGLAPVAPIHFGLDPLLVRLRSLIGQKVIVLADSHVRLLKRATADQVAARTAYYRSYLLQCSGTGPSVVLSSTFVTEPSYVALLYDLLAHIPQSRLRKAQPAALKGQDMADRPIGSVSLVMQCADALHLCADRVFADESQRRIYGLLDAVDPAQLALSKPDLHFATAGCDIRGAHIFDSRSETRISIHDDRDTVARKVGKMYAPPPGQPLEANRRHALHDHFRWSVFPWRSRPVLIRGECGRILELNAFEEYLARYDSGGLHPRECKVALVEALTARIRDIAGRMDTATWHWIKDGAAAARSVEPRRKAMGAMR